MGVQFRENLKHEAHQHVKFQEAQMSEKFRHINVLSMLIIDSHFPVNNKRFLTWRGAEEERCIQNDRITQLEQIVQTQMQHNLKLQSMLDLPVCPGASSSGRGDCCYDYNCRGFHIIRNRVRICPTDFQGSSCCATSENELSSDSQNANCVCSFVG